MFTASENPLAKAYLEQLDDSLKAVDPSRAAVLRSQVVEHLESSLSSSTDESRVREILDELGPPSEIVAEALSDGAPGEGPAVRRSTAARTLGKVLVVIVVMALSLALLVASVVGASVPAATKIVAAFLFLGCLVVLRRIGRRPRR